jgi:hypothetical protein
MQKNLKKFVVLAVVALGVSAISYSFVRADDENEGKEVKVKLTDCPKAVQDTLAKESTGAKKPIETLDQETFKDGNVIYEADVVLADGKNYEIQVAADGKLISKKIDAEENDKK